MAATAVWAEWLSHRGAPLHEAAVAEPQPLRLGSGGRDRLRRLVDAEDPARRIRVCDPERRVPQAAADVEDVDALAQQLDEAGHEPEHGFDVEDGGGQLRLPFLNPLEALPGDAAALAKGAHDVVLHLAEARHGRGEDAEVVSAGGPRERERVLARQPPRPCLRVVLDEPAGELSGEPLADVPLLQPRALRDLVARCRIELRERVVEAGAVPDADREGQHRPTHRPQQPPAELLRPRLVDLLHCHLFSLRCWTEGACSDGLRGACVPVPTSEEPCTELQPRPCANAHAVAAARAVRPETPILS